MKRLGPVWCAIVLAAAIGGGVRAADAGGLGAANRFVVLAAGGGVNFGSDARISPRTLSQVGGKTVMLGTASLVGNDVIAAAASATAISVAGGTHVRGRCITGGGQVIVGPSAGCTGGQDTSGQNPLLTVLSAAGNDAAAFAAELGSQNPTKNLPGINLPANGSTVITLDPGLNIIDVPFIKAGANATITIKGGGSSRAAINVAGNLSLGNGAAILLTGGITPDQLIVNLGGSAILGDSVVLNGALLAASGRCIAGVSFKLRGAMFCTLGVKTLSGALINFSGPFLLRVVYVANENGGPLNHGSVTEYTTTSNGNVPPIATINAPASGTDNTHLFAPHGIALDADGNLYVAGPFGGPSFHGSVMEYKADAKGNAAPIVTISGEKTGLNNPFGVALDALGNIYVANESGGPPRCSGHGCGSITVYNKGANGNVAPIATIAAPASGVDKTLLAEPHGIALDLSDRIYVTNFKSKSSVTEYAARSNGNIAPIATISGDKTAFIAPNGLTLDAAGNIFVVNELGGALGRGTVTEYAAGSNGNVAPIAFIFPEPGGTDNTKLAFPVGIALDGAGHIYVTNLQGGPPSDKCDGHGCGSVNKYRRGSDGNVAPIAIISPPLSFSFPDKTLLRFPFGIVIGD